MTLQICPAQISLQQPPMQQHRGSLYSSASPVYDCHPPLSVRDSAPSRIHRGRRKRIEEVCEERPEVLESGPERIQRDHRHRERPEPEPPRAAPQLPHEQEHLFVRVGLSSGSRTKVAPTQHHENSDSVTNAAVERAAQFGAKSAALIDHYKVAKRPYSRRGSRSDMRARPGFCLSSDERLTTSDSYSSSSSSIRVRRDSLPDTVTDKWDIVELAADSDTGTRIRHRRLSSRRNTRDLSEPPIVSRSSLTDTAAVNS